ncbi:hypothetical protein CL634_08000 [bacterium]|nr:hypothetical protein [bacterium]
MGRTSISAFENSRGASSRSERSVDRHSILQSAVVNMFISNPEYDLEQETLNDEEPTILRESLATGANKVANPQYIDIMPRNSIIATVVSGRGGHSGKGPEIFYPLFSPHFSLPVSPGEQVLVMYENVGNKKGPPCGYWITRRPSDLQVDDLNYTHQDRVTEGLASLGKDESSQTAYEGAPEDTYVPGSFPLGGKGIDRNNTLPGEDPYTSIIDSSFEYQNTFIGQPVARFSKRPNDLTIQGSNNTLICLGTDRIGSEEALAEDIPQNWHYSDEDPRYSGTIDIVAGRGVEGTVTAPAALIDPNERDYPEVDKVPTVTESADASNPLEGDVDFINDLSRIYVSMNTSGDENFGLDLSGLGASEISDAPFVIMKSDEIRIVARAGKRTVSGTETDIAGSIRLISEGGGISLLGPGSIYVGNGSDGAGGSLDTSQPVVKGDLLADHFDQFHTDVETAVGVIVGNMGGPIVNLDLLTDAVEVLAAGVRASLSSAVFTQ